MKDLLTILLLVFTKLSLAQANSTGFFNANKPLIQFCSPDSLSKKLTSSFTTDKEKLKSIFHWVTDNIAYKTRPILISKKSAKFAVEQSDDSLDKSTSLNERIAVEVLKKREAVCDGYARLLKTLCDYAGLRCEIITGYARTNMNRTGEQFKSNHRWNAVLVDSNWYLMDATWASGYISYGSGQFVKAYDDAYFMTPPENFIRDHYPEDSRWTLLVNPPTLKEFYRTPFKHTAFSKYSITSFEPSKGVIEAAIGDTVELELTMASISRNPIAPDTLQEDSKALPKAYAVDMVTSADTNNKKKVIYRYAVSSNSIGWLNVVYNEDVVLRYKLNITKPGHENYSPVASQTMVNKP